MPFVLVTVNYKTPHLTIECLKSLAPEVAQFPGSRVLVVDNDSRDGSVHAIQQAISAHGWGDWVRVIQAPRNGGFSYGNNLAIRELLASDMPWSSVVLVNPDTVSQPGLLQAFERHLRAHANAGIVGAAILNPQGGTEPSAHNFPSALGELEAAAQLAALSRLLQRHQLTPPVSSAAHPCDWVSGACMAIRREVIEQIGLMDEGYFLYFEEVDYCRRARNAGWTCWWTPEACVVHHEGASTGITQQRKRRPAYWYDSRRRYMAKHLGTGGWLLADAMWGLGRLSLTTRRTLGLGGQAQAAAEPTHLAQDLLLGDWRAWRSGQIDRSSLDNQY